jgi:hypothetical protein
MHSVNLDLLHASARHHPDGHPKDPHAHHRAEHLASLRAARRSRWRAYLDRIRRAFALSPSPSKPVLPAKI